MAPVSLANLTKRFDSGVAAVDDVSLEIADGEFAVLVGPSGCGKTTVLRMIAGLEEPTSGSVKIGDREVTHLAPRDRDVAMVFQNYALYPHLTVKENIGFGLKMRHADAATIARRTSDAAELLEIAELLGRRPAQLSGGQRQRVALARAIVREPAVFLFDEPLSNLDAQVRAHTRAELIKLHQRLQATMVYVTHDQVEAMTMAHRVAVMERGRVQQLAPPMELYRRPATLFVASFIGSPSINRLPGRVEPRADGGEFVGAVRVRVNAPPLAGATLAVRAEDVAVGVHRPSNGDGAPGAPAVVVLVEPLGPESHVLLQLSDGHEITARVAGAATVSSGDRVRISFDPERVLVYDERGALVSR